MNNNGNHGLEKDYRVGDDHQRVAYTSEAMGDPAQSLGGKGGEVESGLQRLLNGQ